MPDTALQITSCETCCYYGKRTECRLNVISPRSPNNLTSKESWAPSTVLLELFTLCEGVMSGPWGGSALGYPVFDDETRKEALLAEGDFAPHFYQTNPFSKVFSRDRGERFGSTVLSGAVGLGMFIVAHAAGGKSKKEIIP